MIHGTGRRVVIEQAYGVPSLPAPSIYVASPTAEIDCSSFASGVDTFLHRASAESNRTGSSGLATLLRDLQAERDDKEISSWRKLEAILGFDADRAPDELIERLASYEPRLGESVIDEVAAANPGSQAADILARTFEAAGNGFDIDRKIARRLQSDADSELREQVWETAESAAAQLRKEVGLKAGPVRSRAFGEILGIKWESARQAASASNAFPYAAVSCQNNKDRILFKSPPHAASRRFEMARALADAVWDQDSTFAPISRAKTERQRFQRAFAQSFLCPFDDLREYLGPAVPGETEIENAAVHFSVSEMMVRSLLVNKHILPASRPSPSRDRHARRLGPARCLPGEEQPQ